MRWFKHMSDMLDDPFVVNLVDEFGVAGFGIWCGILETYAKYAGENCGDFVEIPWRMLVQRLRVSAAKIQRVINHCETNAKLFVHDNPKCLEIKIPKMSDLKDEWASRNKKYSGVTREKLPQQIQNTETDLEVDQEKESSSPPPPKSPGVFTKGKTFFTIIQNGVSSSESAWIRASLIDHLKKHDMGWSLDEFMQLFPSTQKTYKRWMAHELPRRMAAFWKVLKNTNAKNELSYALSLADKSLYDFNLFPTELETFTKAVESGDVTVELD